MPVRKPNFFIVGAPKCGTTSLAAWLDSHPEACVSRPKEPHFFSPTLRGTFKTLRDYERCFAHAQPHHKAVGEASTHTIYYVRAIHEMLKYQPQAKFIVCLRNPVEMAFSLHNFLLFFGEVAISDFIEAWDSEKEVLIAFLHRAYKSGEFYRLMCALGTHYKNLKEILPEDRLLTLLLDDLIANEARELKKATDFLEISPSSIPFPKENVTKRARSWPLKQATDWLSRSKQKLGIRKSFGVGGRILQANTVTGIGNAPLPPETRSVLVGHFRPEIRILEQLLDRDLSRWVAPQ